MSKSKSAVNKVLTRTDEGTVEGRMTGEARVTDEGRMTGKGRKVAKDKVMGDSRKVAGAAFKHDNKFKSGEPCFAKVRGFIPYPAKIMGRSERVRKEKYAVLFYGTAETADIEPGMMWPVTKKWRKRWRRCWTSH